MQATATGNGEAQTGYDTKRSGAVKVRLGRAAFWEWVRWAIHRISAPLGFPPEQAAGKVSA